MKRDAIIYCLIQVVLFAAVFIGCFALVGCKSPQPIVQNSVETTDTTDITVRTRDVPVTIEADSASIKALLRCDSAYNVVLDELTTLQGERINANTNVKTQPNGGMLLTMDCKEDSLQNIIQVQDSIIKSLKTRKEKEIVQVPVEQPISNYYKNTSKGFWWLLGILLLIVGWKIAKIYFKIQSGGIL